MGKVGGFFVFDWCDGGFVFFFVCVSFNFYCLLVDEFDGVVLYGYCFFMILSVIVDEVGGFGGWKNLLGWVDGEV